MHRQKPFETALAEAAPPSPQQPLPAHAVSHARARDAWRISVQLVVVATAALGYWVLIAGEAFIALKKEIDNIGGR